MIFAVLICRR